MGKKYNKNGWYGQRNYAFMMEVIEIMDITEAYSMLDKYNLREKADIECERKKIAKAPYDMMGHNEVFSDFLQQVWIDLKTQRDSRLKELGLSIIDETDDEELNRLNKEMKEISDAQNVLKEVAEKDFWLR